MSVEYRQAMWLVMSEMEGDEIELLVERAREQRGRSFSEDALEKLHDELIVFIGTRIMRRWDTTSEPPTLLRVELKVTTA